MPLSGIENIKATRAWFLSPYAKVASDGVDKLLIKICPVILTEQHIANTWDQLKSAKLKILKINNNGLNFEELYRNAYTLVLQQHATLLYSGAKQVIMRHMLQIHHIYVPQNKLDNVYKICMMMFCQYVVRLDVSTFKRHFSIWSNENVKERLSHAHKFVMHAKCSFNWVSFYMYTEDFEQPFLQQTQKFYAAESETLLAQTPSFMLYINNVDQRIEEEISRIYHCFDTSTGTTYVEVLEQGLISRRIDTIDRDVFERYYKQHLAKRLLMGKCQSNDQENSMIAKLVVECGSPFKNKLEGVFNDMSVSKSLMKEFQSQSNSVPLGMDLYVRVLTTSLWPIQSSSSDVSLPAEAEQAFNVFSGFYLGKHTGRKLSLHSNLGHAELSTVFNGPVASVEEATSSS
ncbi:hypothetical protein Aperf_G00000084489 [Anoplocephala perfoliata]